MNKWIKSTSREGKYTHLLLDGGILDVPSSDLSKFYSEYVASVLHGEKLYIVEQKTNAFRFFVDVDFISDTEELDFVKVSQCLHEIVNLGPCILARARPRKVDNVSSRIKYGLHIIWTESIVTKQKAQGIRMHILSEMGSEWEKIIDPSVYMGSGLRMLWSYKNEPDNTSVYVPWGKISENGVFTEFENKKPTIEYLRMFSIRIEDVSSVTVDDDAYEKRSLLHPKNVKDLEEYIQKCIPGHENIRIVKVSKCKNKKDYWIRTTSKYCENVKRCHKSNHVWFCVIPRMKIICQKCQDEECKDFTGKKYRIPSRLLPNEGVLDSSTRSNISEYLPDGWKW